MYGSHVTRSRLVTGQSSANQNTAFACIQVKCPDDIHDGESASLLVWNVRVLVDVHLISKESISCEIT